MSRSRLVAVVVVALGGFGVGCGGGDDPPPSEGLPEGSEPDGSEQDESATDDPIDPDWALEFALAGRSAPMTARAELKVIEGEDAVHVAITGRTSGTDFVMIDLTFESLQEAIGTHSVQFSLPEGGEHIANTSLDDTWYYSQGGQIDLSVGAEGGIEGSFDIDLARGTLVGPGEPVVFAPSEVATELAGTFSGDWVLNCHSRLSGHMALIFGGEFCDTLVVSD